MSALWGLGLAGLIFAAPSAREAQWRALLEAKEAVKARALPWQAQTRMGP
jgi:hypothetical protein